MIHFNEPWFQIAVQHDVKAENLETQTVLDVIWLAASVNMPHCRLSGYERFYNNAFYLLFQFLNLLGALLRTFFSNDISINLLQTLLVSFTSSMLTLVLYVLFTLLIYGIVCQVHVHIFHIASLWTLIMLCCKACKSLLE